MKIIIRLSELLIDIENEMRNIDQWHERRPEESAFQSEQPFFVDTMDFSQWLQFVFIERINVVIESKLSLPDKCGIAPMAEEYFRALPVNASLLTAHLKQLDELISDGENQ